MPAYIFDIETAGLLPGLSQPEHLFIITAINLDTGERLAAKLDECEELARELYAADSLIGHNIFGFDLPALQKCLGWWDRLEDPRDFDTMIAGRLLWSNLYNEDHARGRGGHPLPKNLYGSHSLKAYGMRLGVMKDDYSGGFDEFNEEMYEYAKQDVEVTLALWNRIEADNYSPKALDLEMSIARIMARQERTGFCFDSTAAQELLRDLMAEQATIQARLQAAFGSWEVLGERFTPRASNKTLGYVKGVETRKPSKTVVFNPASRDHIASRLSVMYGWEPEAFTDGGKPKIDETILLNLYEEKGWDVCKDLADNFMITKRLGQLSDGNQAWLRKVTEEGKIHGRVITNGAVSGRATHTSPNMGQVPSSSAPYGERCRRLFVAPRGRVLVGSDASGLELRCLAHFMAVAGDKNYAETVVNGDIHTANQEAAGLATRNEAKTFIYGLLYGAGDAKLGAISGKSAKHGARMRSNFYNALPALKHLVRACQSKAEDRGFLLGLDKRKLHCRSAHSSLNLLLQSAGGVICKKWIVEMDVLFQERGLDVQYHAWVHDEVQLSCPPEQAELVGQACQDAMRLTQEKLNIQCQLDTDFNVGANWAETH